MLNAIHSTIPFKDAVSTLHSVAGTLARPAANAVAHSGTIAHSPNNIDMRGSTSNTVTGGQTNLNTSYVNTMHTYPPARNEEPDAVVVELREMRRTGRLLLILFTALVLGICATAVGLWVFVLRA